MSELVAEQPVERRGSFLWLRIVLLVYLLLLAVSTISAGFKWATGGQAEQLFAFAANPVLGLVVGTVATALIQSSSTVSSIIVGLVAGGLPVTSAIPMIMGANMGTSLTSTLVSLGHVRSRDDFKRAFSAATVHDMFNLTAVIIFLPLEIAFGLLEKVGLWIAGFFVGGDSLSMKGFNFIKPITKPVVSELKALLDTLPHTLAGGLMILLGVAMILVAVSLIGRLLRHALEGRAKLLLHRAIGRGPISGIASGTLVTVLVQSSSTTTSLIVPLVGSGIFRVRDIYPFTLGANIGTCITALLAATAISGASALPALEIAMVHLAFNVLGTLVIFGLPFLREVPLQLAEGLGNLAERTRLVAPIYICGLFFGLPGLMILVDRLLG